MHVTTKFVLFTAFAVSVASSPALAETVLVDFGSDSSFRGVSVSNPDTNGNTWTSAVPGSFLVDLVDTTGAPTAIDLGFSTGVGTDSYNGPAGPTTGPAELGNTDIDNAALGDLGIDAAAYDFAAGDGGAARFEIQQLDPNKTYTLSFFGSHAFSTDSSTVYTVYTDNTYSTVQATASLAIQDDAMPWLHNRDSVATLTGLSPAADNILYVEFVGSNGGNGYLNSMKIEGAIPEPGAFVLGCFGALALLARRR